MYQVLFGNKATGAIAGDSAMYPTAKNAAFKALMYAYELWSNGHSVEAIKMGSTQVFDRPLDFHMSQKSNTEIGWMIVRKYVLGEGLSEFFTELHKTLTEQQINRFLLGHPVDHPLGGTYTLTML